VRFPLNCPIELTLSAMCQTSSVSKHLYKTQNYNMKTNPSKEVQESTSTLMGAEDCQTTSLSPRRLSKFLMLVSMPSNRLNLSFQNLQVHPMIPCSTLKLNFDQILLLHQQQLPSSVCPLSTKSLINLKLSVILPSISSLAVLLNSNLKPILKWYPTFFLRRKI